MKLPTAHCTKCVQMDNARSTLFFGNLSLEKVVAHWGARGGESHALAGLIEGEGSMAHGTGT